MSGKKLKEPMTQHELKCTPSKIVEEMLETIKKDHKPWNCGDVAFICSPYTGAHIVPVMYVSKKLDQDPNTSLCIIESYDGKHVVEEKELYHDKSVCHLALLWEIWDRAEDKAAVEDSIKMLLLMAEKTTNE